MTQVYLRNYQHDVESLIGQGQIDEAIAHCHHILKTFPKHLDTYRLLGKAYLEAKRYDEAADIFRRALMAVPDDFVSHVGMSIVNDEKGKMDEAIWHMERAFEAQPSNAAIQGELQRLYGRRDGVEPPRIRMTRGALANMYIQGELYPQAISEIRAVLAQDEQRTDMQVLLAGAYFRNGQRADAADVCGLLLKRYPYCLDANRIMVELLHGKEHAESTQVYRQRVIELDPYSAFSDGSIFRSGAVADSAIKLEQLEYSGQPVGLGPAWVAEAGIRLDAYATQESTAGPSGRMQSPEKIAEQPHKDQGGSTQPAPEGAELPDFLRQAGWEASSSDAAERGESTGMMESSPVDSAQSGKEPQEELSPASLPGWLKEKMPVEKLEPEITSGEMPDWLGALTSEQPASESRSGEMPEWLGRLTEAQPPKESKTEAMPDWLGSIPSAEGASAAEKASPSIESASATVKAESGGRPDWLKSPAGPEISAHGTGGFFREEEKTEIHLAGGSKEKEPSEVSERPGTTAKNQEDTLAWLGAMAVEPGSKEEKPLSDSQARREEARSLLEPDKTDIDHKEGEPTPEDETGIWLRGLAKKQTTGISPETTEKQPTGSMHTGEQSPEWLEDQASEPITDETPTMILSDVPDWLKDLSTESTTAQGTGAAAQGEETAPGWLKDLEAESTPLESLADTRDELWARPAGDDIQPEQRIQQASDAERSEMPEWLQGLVEEAKEAGPASMNLPQSAQNKHEKASAGELTAEDLPRWLRSLDEEAAGPIPSKAIEDLPEWLKGETDAAPAAEPTTPSDWQPLGPQTEGTPRDQDRLPIAPASEPREAVEPAQDLDTTIVSARDLLKTGDINAALDQYYRLVKQGRLLDESIHDLREALDRYPIDASLWQALGDAYMRANRLQEALDAYNQAEGLLR